MGAQVIATTRNPERFASLRALGAHTPMGDSATLSQEMRKRHPKGIDAVLDLVGTSTLLDSLAMVRPDGRACMAGFLGGGAPLAAFDPLLHMPSGVQLSFFASAFTFGNADYPLSATPLQHMIDRVADGTYKAKPVRVFRLDEIEDAHRLMESNAANGKIVVRL
jgi:NADPH:quinone reductase-like Zn-dependent oxidoreductase